MTVNDTDKFLVNRNSSSFYVEAQNLMAELKDDDLMLVNRANRSYSATGAEIKDSLGPKGRAPVIDICPLRADDPDNEGFASQSFTTTIEMEDDGEPPSTKSIRASIEAKLMVPLETSPIKSIGSIKEQLSWVAVTGGPGGAPPNGEFKMTPDGLTIYTDTYPSARAAQARGIKVTTGKWYFECLCDIKAEKVDVFDVGWGRP